MSGHIQSTNHSSDTEIGKHNQWQLVLLVEDTVLAKVEVGDLHALGTIVLLARQVEEEVTRPAEDLMDEIMPESRNWGVLGQFRKLDHGRLCLLAKVRLDPVFSGVWHERSVSIHVSSRLVVLGVGQTPGVEWHQEERVHDQAHGVIEQLVLGEGAVSTLVCENPDAREDTSCREAVCRPRREPKVGIGEERDVRDGEEDEDTVVEVVADDIGHRAEDGRLEAVGGDGIVDLLHGEGGQLEDISVEIEMLAVAGGVVGGHCCRWRGSGGLGDCLCSHGGGGVVDEGEGAF